jgi:hypothetical protein
MSSFNNSIMIRNHAGDSAVKDTAKLIETLQKVGIIKAKAKRKKATGLAKEEIRQNNDMGPGYSSIGPGALSSNNLNGAINIIKGGTVANVEYEFNCNLNPGIYFVNVGVFGLLDGSEIVLHRRAEIIAFRVLPEADNIETEIVNLSFNPLISLS